MCETLYNGMQSKWDGTLSDCGMSQDVLHGADVCVCVDVCVCACVCERDPAASSRLKLKRETRSAWSSIALHTLSNDTS